jgi:hypothetical protein
MVSEYDGVQVTSQIPLEEQTRYHENNKLSIATAHHPALLPVNDTSTLMTTALIRPSTTLVPPSENTSRRLTLRVSPFLANIACEHDILGLASASYLAEWSYVTAGLPVTEPTAIFTGDGVARGHVFVSLRVFTEVTVRGVRS